jgi:hypothetical protein
MRYEPWIPKREPKPFVFIVDANSRLLEICDETGGSKRYTTVESAEARLTRLGNKTVIYSLVNPKQLILFGGAQNWKVIKYHERVQRLVYKGKTSIHSWSTFGPDPQALIPFFDALKELGVGPASLTTMVRNSWRRMLPHRQSIIEWGSGPKIGRAAFFGGRKEALQPLPAIYSGVKYLDLPAAYLQGMQSPLPMHLRETNEPRWCDDGICEAIVSIPEQSWNPLPFRLGYGKRGVDLECYAYGQARGVFIISELRNAIENHGVHAELIRVWKGYQFKEPFAEWLPWALEMRKLPGMSGVAAKSMTTRLWSIFGVNPNRHRKVELTFEDAKGERKIITQVPSTINRRVEGSAFISAIIASRVRVRLLEELIPAGAVHVDTDGGIVPSTVTVPGWAQKRVMDVVELRSCQAYRWQCPDCPNCSGRHPTDPWHYSVAGFRPDDSMTPMVFEHHPRNGLLRANSQAAVAIPAQPLSEAKQGIGSVEVEATSSESL